jgi:HlyD family secretion protein
MKKIILIISIIAVILVGAFFLFGWFSQQQVNALMENLETESIQMGTLSSAVGATGIVRSNQSAYLLWKIPGQVDQVMVDVGETVNSDNPLAILDETTLPSYIILAQADLVNARNQLNTLLSSPTQQANALKAVEEAQKALEDAYNPEMAQAEAQTAIAFAELDLENAQTQLAILTKPVSREAIDQAYANMLLAENKLNNLKDEIAKKERKLNGPFNDFWESPKYYRTILEGLNMQLPQLQLRYEETVSKYNNLREPPDPLDVAVAEAAVFAAQAQLDDAYLQYERIKDGFSPADIAVLEAQLADAQREYERVKDGASAEDIAILETQITASEATLQQTTISAPFDGTITLIETQPGDQVDPGSLAFRLDDLSKLFVEVNVSEIDIGLVQTDQDVIVTFDAILAKEYTGKVIDIAPVGTTDSGLTTFKVTVELLDADEEIRPGMTSEVSVVTSEVENVLMVPNRAIRLLDGERVVYVLRDNPLEMAIPENENSVELPFALGSESPLNTIEAIPITLGASSDLYSEIISGDLTIGDKVILNPPSDGLPSSQGGGIIVRVHP